MADLPEESLGILFSDVARLFWRRLEAAFAAEGLDFTAGEARTLITLCDSPGLRQTQLAERLHIEPMTVTGFLDRLAARDLIERRPDPCDRRAKLVHPTETGRTVIPRVRAAAAGVRATLATGLTPADVAELRRLTRHVRANLAARVDAEAGA